MLLIFPTENLFAQTLDGGFVILYLQCFDGALQLVYQFWIKAAHAIGEFHTEN